MKRRTTFSLILALAIPGLGPGAGAAGAETGADTIAVPISDPARPVSLRASLVNGGLTVEGYEGSEVLIEARERPGSGDDGPERRDGMMRIPNTGFGLSVSEQDNQVTISTEWSRRPVDLTLRVPRRTSVRLSTVNNGDLRIEGVTGEHELSNTNGAIHALGVSGSVVAGTTNGPVKVTFVDMTGEKPMSFTTWNGDVDVTFPPGLRADLKLEAGRGDVYSDFEVDLEPVKTRTQREGSGGVFRVRLERAVEGTVGGGAELHFKTFNGDIYLRRAGG